MTHRYLLEPHCDAAIIANITNVSFNILNTTFKFKKKSPDIQFCRKLSKDENRIMQVASLYSQSL